MSHLAVEPFVMGFLTVHMLFEPLKKNYKQTKQQKSTCPHSTDYSIACLPCKICHSPIDCRISEQSETISRASTPLTALIYPYIPGVSIQRLSIYISTSYSKVRLFPEFLPDEVRSLWPSCPCNVIPSEEPATHPRLCSCKIFLCSWTMATS